MCGDAREHMDDETLRAHLRRFGLSGKEVDTYLALLAYGEAKASTIADAAGVSKRYVYSVSESLATRGFVDVRDHVVPTTIRAIPPDEVVSQLRADAEAIRTGVDERLSRTKRDTAQFEVVKSRATADKRIRSLINDADAEVTLAVSTRQLDAFRDVLAAAVDRGVLALVIATGADGTDTTARLDGVASVARTWEESMPTLLTVDATQGLVAPPALLSRSDGDQRAIVFRQARLTPVIVGSFMGNYWPAATEASVSSPATLPAAYEACRHAVFQATRHRREGTALRATVAGRRTEDGEPVELTGRVVAVKQGMVTPTNNEFPVEHSLTIETDEGRVTAGGRGAFIEDIEADLIRLHAACE